MLLSIAKCLAMVMVVLLAAWVGSWIPPAIGAKRPPPPPAPVPETGQTQCWDGSGLPIPCEGTGQDGDLRAGAPWPMPRFTDHGNGTVTDRLTGLIWLQEADCLATLMWAQALAAADALADDPTSTTTDCGLSDGSQLGDWRVPTVKELQSLVDFSTFSPALPAGYPFTYAGNPFPIYWSSTSYEFNPGNAWVVDLVDGSTNDDVKDVAHRVWPVRGGP